MRDERNGGAEIIYREDQDSGDDFEKIKEVDFNDMDIIDELETVFHDAHDDIMSQNPSLAREHNLKNRELLYLIEEDQEEEVKG